MGDTDYEQRHVLKRRVVLLHPSRARRIIARQPCSLFSIFFNKYAFVFFIKKINFLVSLLVFKRVLVSYYLKYLKAAYSHMSVLEAKTDYSPSHVFVEHEAGICSQSQLLSNHFIGKIYMKYKAFMYIFIAIIIKYVYTSH